MAVSDEGRAGQRLALGRAVPTRRERAAHRHRAPARALRHRPLLGGASPSDGLGLPPPCERDHRGRDRDLRDDGVRPSAGERQAGARLARRARPRIRDLGRRAMGQRGGRKAVRRHQPGWAQLRDAEFPGHGPVGVVGQIIPWNFPLLMVAWKVAPALAAGNTIVLKPAEFTPLTALAFAEIAQQAGLPPGVLNVITGDGTTGKLLVDHPDVDKIAFTGSTEVGRIIRQATAGSGKRLSLELGGKSPFVVFEDADLDSVVEGVVDAIWFNQGQVCCAGSRLLVQEGVAQRLIAKLRARMEKLRVGPPLDKAVDMGAIVAPVQLERIRGLVNKGVEEGAKMWQPSWACPTEGYFYPPTLFTDVSPAATIAQVEIFGPVLVSMSFRTPTEAVALANNTPYGLAASVWTENINLALDIAPKIKAGVGWVNCTNLLDAASGVGGDTESGFGREGGGEGMWEYGKREWEQGAGSREQAPPK